MNKKLLLFLMCMPILSFAQQIPFSFSEDFENYTLGDKIAEISTEWETLTSLDNGVNAPYSDDATIYNAQFLSGSYSGIIYTDPLPPYNTGILVLPLHETCTTGVLTFTAHVNSFYTNGFSHHIVFKESNYPWGINSLDLQENGNIDITNHYSTYANYDFIASGIINIGTWNEIKVVADLTNNNWEVFYNNTSIVSFSNSVNSIGAISFAATNGHDFYVDDISITYVPDAVSGMSELINEKITVSPNPSNGIFSIHSDDIIKSIEVVNVLGEVALKENNLNKKSIKLDLDDFLKGTYFIRIKSEENIINKKIILQ